MNEDEARARIDQARERYQERVGHLPELPAHEPAPQDARPGPAPCFSCGNLLEPVFPESNFSRQPSGAVVFTASGNYGSEVFDPMDGGKLMINICDQCLRHAKTGTVTLMSAITTKSYTYAPWKDET